VKFVNNMVEELSVVVKILMRYWVNKAIDEFENICRFYERVMYAYKITDERHEVSVRILKGDSAENYDTTVEVEYRRDVVKCRLAHYEKYQRLYKHHENRKTNEGIRPSFEDALYVMLKRYDNIIYQPNSKSVGGNMHAAAPEKVFHFLQGAFSVQFECFASPNNCFFPYFCSAFPDTDWPFGSCGSFFDLEMLAGAFEVGPPYTEEVLLMTCHHVELLLERSRHSNPLTFFVFVPDWTDCEGISRLRHSNWCTAEIVGVGGKHWYVSGVQHIAKRETNERYYRPPHGTICFVLQNHKAKQRLPMYEPVKDELRGRMQDRDYPVRIGVEHKPRSVGDNPRSVEHKPKTAEHNPRSDINGNWRERGHRLEQAIRHCIVP